MWGWREGKGSVVGEVMENGLGLMGGGTNVRSMEVKSEIYSDI
jgi:hypothetical protein